MWDDLRRVLGLWAPHRGALLLGGAVTMLSALAGLSVMALAGKGVAAGVAAGSLAGLAALGWLRWMVALRPAMRWAERMSTHASAFRALATTRIWFFSRLAERMPGGIGHRTSGDLLGRLVSDVDALDRLYLGAIVPAAAALAVVLAIAALLGAEPLLLALVATPLALALLLPLALAPAAARDAQRVAARRGTLRAAAADPLAGLEDTLAAGAEPAAARGLAAADAGLMEAQRHLAHRSALAGAAGAFLTQMAVLAALAWGLSTGQAGPAVLALFLAVAAAETLGLLPRAGLALAAAAAAARRLFDAADAVPPVAEPAPPPPMPTDATLRLEGLHFAWAPGAPEVLGGVDLALAPGERVAILGPSGAGKSSLAALLQKLAAPTAGRITLGGTDIAELPAAALRERVVVLSQHARIFDDSVAANLRLAAPAAPEAALWRALAKADMAEKIRGLPEGLETRCGEGGSRFSGGEVRRLALARALLPPAAILILDEPTAGLDAETERRFLEQLAIATEGRSLILTTHRLTGVERPDRVLRLAGGRLLEAAA